MDEVTTFRRDAGDSHVRTATSGGDMCRPVSQSECPSYIAHPRRVPDERRLQPVTFRLRIGRNDVRGGKSSGPISIPLDHAFRSVPS